MTLLSICMFFVVVPALAANNTTQPQTTVKSGERISGNVIDLGELQIEGEVRRPSVNWIDSNKRVLELIPLFHREEFLKLERELVKPISKSEAQFKLELNASRSNLQMNYAPFTKMISNGLNGK